MNPTTPDAPPPPLAPPSSPSSTPQETTKKAAEDLGALIAQGFAGVHKELAQVVANLACVANKLDVVEGRVVNVEKRQDLLDDWRRSNSERVRGMVSEGDAAHESKLATEIVARRALETKVDALGKTQDALVKTQETQIAMLGRIEALATNLAKSPQARRIATAAASALLTWLTIKGAALAPMVMAWLAR